MATAPSPNDLTRQQLDELDALLQKMLSAPLAPVETPPPAATLPPLPAPPLPPSWRADPPFPAPTLAHLTTAEPPASVPFANPVAERARVEAAPPPAPKPTPAPAPPPPVAVTPAPKPPAPKPTPAPTAAPAPKAAAPAQPVTPAPDAPPVPLVLLPLVALNGLFDGICGLFGPPGRLLCSGFFKHIYGLAGIGLIGYTALRVAQVQGWLSLPVPLPWPK